MDKKYLNYSTDDLIAEESFISFVLNDSNKGKWEAFIKENPDFERKAIEASEIILLLHDVKGSISKENIDSVWNKIEKFRQNEDNLNRRIIRLRSVLQYAAIILLVFMASGTGYFFIKNGNRKNQILESSQLNVPGNSKLILSDGKEIDLKRKESAIHIKSADEVILINNDSVVRIAQNIKKHQSVKEYNKVVIPYGKRSVIELEDGTKVWLNSGSVFAFPDHFTENKREVFLKGEAYFIVAHNESKPFFVKINELDIKVLGTSFNVSAYDNDKDIQTVLVEGKVTISGNSLFGFNEKETVLKPNQKAVFTKEGKTLFVSDEPDVSIYTAWVEGWLPFEKDNLLNVFNRLERYYNVKFIYDKSFSSDGLISGKLDLKDSISDVLTALSGLSKISYEIENGNIYIESKLK
ncbi:MAG: FecR domain-containing protein [Bacteroidales bacterium]|nr:FecR domain-containing protein [Bacteroidales bacterium]